MPPLSLSIGCFLEPMSFSSHLAPGARAAGLGVRTVMQGVGKYPSRNLLARAYLQQSCMPCLPISALPGYYRLKNKKPTMILNQSLILLCLAQIGTILKGLMLNPVNGIDCTVESTSTKTYHAPYLARSS